jgi:hypothetical protein
LTIKNPSEGYLLSLGYLKKLNNRVGLIKQEAAMKRVTAITTMFFLGFLMATLPSSAGQVPGTQISKILEYKASLELTSSQVKKLELVQKTAQQKMDDSKFQADIRLNEIEKFTSNWTEMNSVAVLGLIKEYFKYKTDFKTAEIEAVIQARAILDMNQLTRFQQLVSIETLMLGMEQGVASR